MVDTPVVVVGCSEIPRSVAKATPDESPEEQSEGTFRAQRGGLTVQLSLRSRHGRGDAAPEFLFFSLGPQVTEGDVAARTPLSGPQRVRPRDESAGSRPGRRVYAARPVASVVDDATLLHLVACVCSVARELLHPNELGVDRRTGSEDAAGRPRGVAGLGHAG